MSDNFLGDPSLKYPLLVSGIPIDPTSVSFTTGTLPGNSQLILGWKTTPAKPQLSLWNFQWSVRFGTNASGYEWPEGASLTTNQALVQISAFTDVLASDDFNDVRVNKIILRNGSADSFSYYMFFKSYTFATSVGTLSS